MPPKGSGEMHHRLNAADRLGHVGVGSQVLAALEVEWHNLMTRLLEVLNDNPADHPAAASDQDLHSKSAPQTGEPCERL